MSEKLRFISSLRTETFLNKNFKGLAKIFIKRISLYYYNYMEVH